MPLPGSPVFILDPNQIAGADGSLVSLATNVASPGVLDATAVGGLRPTLLRDAWQSADALRFGGSQRLTVTGLGGSASGFSVYVVGRPDNAFSPEIWFNGPNSVYSDVGKAKTYDGGFRQTFAPVADHPTILGFRGNASGLKYRVNGDVETFTAVSFLAPWTDSAIGAAGNGDLPLTGDVYAVVVYNSYLNDSDDALVYDYLRGLVPLPVLGASKTAYLFDGNSLMQGVGIAGTYADDLPNQSMSASGIAEANRQFINLGIGGQKTSEMIPRGATYVDPLFPVGGIKNVLTFWENTNDIWLGGVDAATAYSNMTTYLAARKAAMPGLVSIVLGMLPRESDAGKEATRQSLRTLCMAGTTAVPGRTNIYSKGADSIDYYVDLASVTHIGANGDQNNATYFTDTIHLTTAGYAVVAGVLAPLLGDLYTTPTPPPPSQANQSLRLDAALSLSLAL